MKLIIAIVSNEDNSAVAAALTKENFTVTKLSTTGGFLMVGNTTFLMGVEDERVGRAKEIIAQHSKTRSHSVNTTESFGRGLSDGALANDVKVGGATVFVLSVDEIDKY